MLIWELGIIVQWRPLHLFPCHCCVDSQILQQQTVMIHGLFCFVFWSFCRLASPDKRQQNEKPPLEEEKKEKIELKSITSDGETNTNTKVQTPHSGLQFIVSRLFFYEIIITNNRGFSLYASVSFGEIIFAFVTLYCGFCCTETYKQNNWWHWILNNFIIYTYLTKAMFVNVSVR